MEKDAMRKLRRNVATAERSDDDFAKYVTDLMKVLRESGAPTDQESVYKTISFIYGEAGLNPPKADRVSSAMAAAERSIGLKRSSKEFDNYENYS